ncbi:MAG: glycoside hydrolase family 71/99-like protein [Pirellulales bacterium]
MRPHWSRLVTVLWLSGALVPVLASGQEPLTRDAVLARMQPYEGPSTWETQATGIEGRVLCGYQGWFTTPDDGAERGWTHYQRQGRFEPGQCSIDLWPDVSDLPADERVPTAFRHADGRVAQVFSSYHERTVRLHWQWMRDYGIDGAFVQRFAVETRQPRNLRHVNQVLDSCRRGANEAGRVYAVMYDLSGLPAQGLETVIADWKELVDRLHLGRDPRDRAYLRERGRPVVAVWGLGFNDGRQYTLEEGERLVRFLKDDPQYGGNTVLLGVPTGWRTLNRDCVADPRLHDIVRRADIVSPWSVGRYRTPQQAAVHGQRVWQADREWCQQAGLLYLPVAFPGFSWSNLKPGAPFDEIPRLRGQFLWSQYVAARRSGATMMYQAMFDELDEGTAIFKCTAAPPVGASRFVAEEGLPSDHYLWLTGRGRQLLRGEIPLDESLPQRP